jgi:hypothetical protein
MNDESPETKPDNQKGSGISLNIKLGLVTVTTFGKASFIISGRPLLRLDFNPTIFSRP